jgi:hypothetical protein
MIRYGYESVYDVSIDSDRSIRSINSLRSERHRL